MAQISKASLRRSSNGKSPSVLRLVTCLAIVAVLLYLTFGRTSTGSKNGLAEKIRGTAERIHQRVRGPSGNGTEQSDRQRRSRLPPEQRKPENAVGERTVEEEQTDTEQNGIDKDADSDVDGDSDNENSDQTQSDEPEEEEDESRPTRYNQLRDMFDKLDAVEEKRPVVGIDNAGRDVYLYHHFEKGKAADVVQKIVMAHAVTYSRGAIFGGSCAGDEIDRTKHRDLLEALGLMDVMPFSCPRDRLWDKHSRRAEIAPKEVAQHGFRVFTPEYIEYLHSRVRYEPKPPDAPFTIVVHMRRKKLKPCSKPHRGYVRFLPNLHYQTQIDRYMQPGAKVVIYGQSKSFEPMDDFVKKGYDVRIDAPEPEVYKSIANADVVILSRSDFSSLAAVVARGTVVYTPFWQRPLKHWHVVDKRTMRETAKEMERLSEKCQLKKHG